MSLILTVMTGLVESQPTLDSGSVLAHVYLPYCAESYGCFINSMLVIDKCYNLYANSLYDEFFINLGFKSLSRTKNTTIMGMNMD